MSYPIVSVVLLVVASLTSASLDARFGVDPVFYDLYSRSTISCQGKGSIPISKVNDEYCDCPDKGEDEPGTSACSNGTFFCKNIGSKAARIESWRVNDGICDCCDGSDEYLVLRSCPSTCEQEGKTIKEHLENLSSTIKTGLKEKQKLLISGAAMKDKQARQLAELQSGIEARKSELENLRRQVEIADAAAKAEKDNADAIAKAEKDNQEPQKGHSEAENTKDSEKEIQSDSKEKETETNSQSHSSSFPYPEQYAYSGNSPEGNQNSESSFPYPEQYAPQNQRGETSADVAAEAEEEGSEDAQEDESSQTVETESTEPESLTAKAAKEARRAFNDAENQLTSLEKEVDDLSRMLSIDYGPNDAYRALQSECFTTTHEKYTYELCPFKEASQIESQTTSLGSFQTWSNGYSEWLFDHGQRCWNGPERSVQVKLSCGLRNQIVSVHEPSTCVYEMQFETPAACSQAEADKLNSELSELSQPEQFRDEL